MNVKVIMMPNQRCRSFFSLFSFFSGSFMHSDWRSGATFCISTWTFYSIIWVRSSCPIPSNHLLNNNLEQLTKCIDQHVFHLVPKLMNVVYQRHWAPALSTTRVAFVFEKGPITFSLVSLCYTWKLAKIPSWWVWLWVWPDKDSVQISYKNVMEPWRPIG